MCYGLGDRCSKEATPRLPEGGPKSALMRSRGAREGRKRAGGDGGREGQANKGPQRKIGYHLPLPWRGFFLKGRSNERPMAIALIECFVCRLANVEAEHDRRSCDIMVKGWKGGKRTAKTRGLGQPAERALKGIERKEERIAKGWRVLCREESGEGLGLRSSPIQHGTNIRKTCGRT